MDVRLVAATRSDLEAAGREGRFRADLLYRLQEVTIRLPALRERGADLQLLAEHFAAQAAAEAGRPAPTFHDSAWEKLRGYSWPGNVRELKNIIRRAVLVSQGPHLVPADLELGSALPESSGSNETAASRVEPLPASRSPGSGEDEAVAGLRQAIHWALRTDPPNASRLLHDLLDRELIRVSRTDPGSGRLLEGGLADLLQSIRRSGVLEPEQQQELDRQRLPNCTAPGAGRRAAAARLAGALAARAVCRGPRAGTGSRPVRSARPARPGRRGPGIQGPPAAPQTPYRPQGHSPGAPGLPLRRAALSS